MLLISLFAIATNIASVVLIVDSINTVSTKYVTALTWRAGHQRNYIDTWCRLS